MIEKLNKKPGSNNNVPSIKTNNKISQGNQIAPPKKYYSQLKVD